MIKAHINLDTRTQAKPEIESVTLASKLVLAQRVSRSRLTLIGRADCKRILLSVQVSRRMGQMESQKRNRFQMESKWNLAAPASDRLQTGLRPAPD